MTPLARTLGRALAHALDHLEGLEERPVGATLDAAALREQLGGPLPETGRDAADVVDELAAAARGGLLGSAGGRFYAWVMGGGVPASLAADWLTSAWDQNAALYTTAPAAAVAEEVAGSWILELLDLPRESSFAFTTGCQMAHVTCLAAARNAVFAARGWDVAEAGLFGAPRLRVIVSEHRHGTVDRALRLLGCGDRSIVALPSQPDGTLDAAAFGRALEASDAPTIVVLSAGDINVAAFEPFRELVPMAKARGAWVHVDGAFGLIARASRARRGLMDGIDLADSWATDAHKWLNVPFDSGIAIMRDRDAHRAAMRSSGSYVTPADGARDPIDHNPEWSRRARGFAIVAALRELGREGVEAMVDRGCARAADLVDGMGALPNVEVVWRPTLNQGLVRFVDPRGVTAADHDAFTDRVIEGVNATGEAFFSGTTWSGGRCMRVSVVNWRTSPEDVARAVRAVGGVLSATRA
jgi:glutamate/tyrosine decarboxylase-like PLP-dependent enzyme